MTRLDEVKHETARLMDRILKQFKPGNKITVLVRNPAMETADFMMTDDDPTEVMKMLQRRIDAGMDRPL